MSQFQRICGVWRAVTRAQPPPTKANHHLGERCERCHQPKPCLYELEIQPKTVWGPRTTKVCIPCMAKVRAEERVRASGEKKRTGRRAA